MCLWSPDYLITYDLRSLMGWRKLWFCSLLSRRGGCFTRKVVAKNAKAEKSDHQYWWIRLKRLMLGNWKEWKPEEKIIGWKMKGLVQKTEQESQIKYICLVSCFLLLRHLTYLVKCLGFEKKTPWSLIMTLFLNSHNTSVRFLLYSAS
jgi:hypothetical protein